MRLKLWLFRFSLLLPTLLLLVLLEVVARLHAYYSDQSLKQGMDGVGLGPTADDLSLQHIIRWSANPRIIYELIPGLSGEFRGHRLTINSQGFRGPEVPLAKPTNGYRIVGLGDSVMFGWGVEDGEDYIARLGQQISIRLPGIQVDWINSAVPGYNTVNEVEVLKEKLLQYAPDLVIVGYVNNDLFVPGFIRKSRPYFSLQRSFAAQFIRNAIDGLHVPANELQRPPDDFRHRTFVGEEELIPEAYRDVIGIQAFRRAMEELIQLSHSHDFELLVFAHFGFSQPVLDALQELGAPTLDAYPTISGWMADRLLAILEVRGSAAEGESAPAQGARAGS